MLIYILLKGRAHEGQQRIDCEETCKIRIACMGSLVKKKTIIYPQSVC